MAPLVTGVFTVLVILFAPLGLVGTVRMRYLRYRSTTAARDLNDSNDPEKEGTR